MRSLLLVLGCLTCALAAFAAGGRRVEFSWPTPNPAWAEGRPPRDFLQHAGSGDPESGGFGGVRSGGSQFHEGIDIRCLNRDRRGEPTDPVTAAMDGVVRHINAVAGDSNYGRYVVLEHPDETPCVYTLYAHLARIAPGLREGARVTRGQVLGLMGHSSSGKIPRDRAHLHFEIGLMATRDFQSWYNSRKFGSPNEQGLWNGMNLIGIDPLDFLGKWRERKLDTFAEYFAQLEPAVKLRIATTRVPDFVLRYPALLTQPLPAGVTGWEVTFDWTGLPFRWTPLTGTEAIGLAPNRPRILDVNAGLVRRERSRTLVVMRRGTWVVAHDLNTMLEQLFGLH
ncbi:MAG: M23 family metallopeptidase [Verrucomicrobia bacterium]|nr:M23 family metallopeptidase [Verrucomicrobiota bacterium]